MGDSQLLFPLHLSRVISPPWGIPMGWDGFRGKRGSTNPLSCRYTAASVIDTASKYKLLWKLPLEDVDIIKGLPLPDANSMS